MVTSEQLTSPGSKYPVKAAENNLKKLWKKLVEAEENSKFWKRVLKEQRVTRQIWDILTREIKTRKSRQTKANHEQVNREEIMRVGGGGEGEVVPGDQDIKVEANTYKVIMENKIKDAKVHEKEVRRKKRDIVMEYKKTEPNQKKRKWVLGKNKEYGDKERKKERKKLDKKLSRMKKIKFRSKKRNKGDNIEIPLPDIIKEYGDLSIFKVKDEERRIAGRAPPVILGDIKLSREEEELLSLGPKFTVAEEEVNETDLIEELEKALVKLKIGLIEETEAIKKREEEEAEYGGSGKTVEETQEEKEERKWESVKRTQVMDFENNTWDLGRLRPTGMKYNKRMKLPKGGDRGIEAEFEIRRREIRRVVEEYNERI